MQLGRSKKLNCKRTQHSINSCLWMMSFEMQFWMVIMRLVVGIMLVLSQPMPSCCTMYQLCKKHYVYWKRLTQQRRDTMICSRICTLQINTILRRLRHTSLHLVVSSMIWLMQMTLMIQKHLIWQVIRHQHKVMIWRTLKTAFKITIKITANLVFRLQWLRMYTTRL